MFRNLFVLLSALLIAAPAVAQDAAVPAADQGAQVVITLQSSGGEPREPLRYDLAAIQPQSLHMDMDMSVGMGFAGQMFNQAMPTIRSTMSTGASEVNDDGNLRLPFRVESMEVMTTGGNADPMIVAAMEQALADFGAFGGTLVMDDRGNMISSEFDLSEMSPQLRQQFESTLQTVQQSVVPFPEEPVGVGAQWTVGMDISMQGMALNQSATYEVVERTDSTVRIASTISQSANAQTLQLPDLPAGSSAELLSHSGTGSGSMTIRFDQAMPEGNFAISTESSMRIAEGGGAPMQMDMTMAISATMRAAE